MPSERYLFRAINPALAEASLLPMLPLVLSRAERTASVAGLLDTGAAVNVLPYQLTMHKIQPLPFIGLTILLGLVCGLLLYLGLMLGSAGQWEQLSPPEKAVEIVTYAYPGLIVRSSTNNFLGCDEQSRVCKEIHSWPPESMLSWGRNPCESSRLSVPLAPGEVIDHIELNYCYDGTNGQLDFVILEDGSIWRWSKQGRTADEVRHALALGSLGALVGGITGAVILRRRSGEGSQALS